MIYTRQVLDPGRLTDRQRHWDDQLGLCLKGSWEAELFIDPVPRSVIVTKPRFDVWQSPEFLSYLQDDPVDGFIIAGVEELCPVQPIDCNTVFENNVGQGVDPAISDALEPLLDALH